MKDHPIHKNLSTSFVGIDALVRHLRALQFVGSIRIEQGSYDADIIFTRANRIQAREHDHASGRVIKGVRAFQRIMLRAREPHGRIHVYQSILPVDARKSDVRVDASISASARQTISGKYDSPAVHLLPRKTLSHSQASGDDWDVMLDLTAELLRTVDQSLEKSGIRFADVFANACALVSEECPFIDPNRGLFEYSGGNVRVGTVMSSGRFLDAVTKALGRVFDRLRDEPEFEKLLLSTSLRIRTLMRNRNDAYQRLGFAKRLHQMLPR